MYAALGHRRQRQPRPGQLPKVPKPGKTPKRERKGKKGLIAMRAPEKQHIISILYWFRLSLSINTSRVGDFSDFASNSLAKTNGASGERSFSKPKFTKLIYDPPCPRNY
ncbi:hypothetical protein AVEN_162860-1 [Araneus ventricosus]|uniref:Uncharacterized protein n=1 Tax=Araneus ventricosus TaxID=182803 RepID=A0A4Y2C6S1_ARAVE|nr:hypothetical protein AVEN_162860-1 [Araneus ventricosus]